MWSTHINEIVSTHGYSLNQIAIWRYPCMQKIATLTGHTYRSNLEFPSTCLCGLCRVPGVLCGCGENCLISVFFYVCMCVKFRFLLGFCTWRWVLMGKVLSLELEMKHCGSGMYFQAQNCPSAQGSDPVFFFHRGVTLDNVCYVSLRYINRTRLYQWRAFLIVDPTFINDDILKFVHLYHIITNQCCSTRVNTSQNKFVLPTILVAR